MASPQLENGYTKIANEIMDALIAYRIPGEQRQVLDFIIRKTYGFNKMWDIISNSQFVEATGLKKPTICRALNELIRKRLVIKNDNNYIPSYRFNKDYRLWQKLSKKITKKQESSDSAILDESVIKNDNKKVLSKMIPTKDNISTYVFKFKNKVAIPENIYLTDDMIFYANKNGCNDISHIKYLFERFRNFWGDNQKKRNDWHKTFYNWILNDKKKYHPNHYKQKEYI